MSSWHIIHSKLPFSAILHNSLYWRASITASACYLKKVSVRKTLVQRQELGDLRSSITPGLKNTKKVDSGSRRKKTTAFVCHTFITVKCFLHTLLIRRLGSECRLSHDQARLMTLLKVLGLEPPTF